ncbi:hypothetical protein BCR37DRAFT_393794 [Protomyces lactucae-debilis]|uniref:Structure-specific endonuclease subunit SLX4 n=1 Tax=Protomyces lactucae-debilis TaxID=2754530 RepID=A0A1Y2FC49_PROLT|nr:uncharacterized protein BCR37DRAFT_393794 [Protomyces lactucae-debilis]ORY80435.1 hypothetical protein BCR37DRAFT_393794 [Protomyces lactucae-debilis]
MVDTRPTRLPQQPRVLLNKARSKKSKKVTTVTQHESEVRDFREVLTGFSNTSFNPGCPAKPSTVDKEAVARRRKEAALKRKLDREAAAALQAQLPKRAKTITELAVRLHEDSSPSIHAKNARIVDYFSLIKPAVPRPSRAKSGTSISVREKRRRSSEIIQPLVVPSQLLSQYKLQKFTFTVPSACALAEPLFISRLHGICRNLWNVSGNGDAVLGLLASSQPLADNESATEHKSAVDEFASTQEYLSFLVADEDSPFRASQTLKDFPVDPQSAEESGSHADNREHQSERSPISALLLPGVPDTPSKDDRRVSSPHSIICIDDSCSSIPVPTIIDKDLSLIVLSSSEDEVPLGESRAEHFSYNVMQTNRQYGSLASSTPPANQSMLLIPDSEEEDAMPLRQLLSAKKRAPCTPTTSSTGTYTRRPIDLSDSAIRPEPLEANRVIVNADQAINVDAQARDAHTNYDRYSDKQLSKQLDHFGFKTVKQRSGMIALLTRCHAAENGFVAQSSSFTTSAAASAKRASPSKKALPTVDLTVSQPAKKAKAPAMSKEERAAIRAQQAADKTALKASQAAEKLAQRHLDKVRLAEDKLQRQVQFQADVAKFLTEGVCAEGDAWYAKILTFEPIVLEDFAQSMAESAWYQQQNL